MKKKEIIVLSISIISLITVSLYQTLATDITMNKVNSTDADLQYTFDITDQTGRVVNVASGATKILDVFVTNPNNGTIKYGIAYTPSAVKTDDITIAQLNTSKDSVSGSINKDERKQITLVIINNSTSDITLSLVAVTGYEHGGDLIVPSNHTLITESYEIEEPAPLASEYIMSLLSSNPSTMNNDDPDGNVRYMGANPNNYVSFNNELWRIIGVFDVKSSENGQPEKRLKIIRDESIGSMLWDDPYQIVTRAPEKGGGENDWSEATLQNYLNGEYYNSFDSSFKSLIGETYWNLGGASDYTSASNGLASHFYGYERGTTVYSGRPTYWIGKIGLMYPSDYGYATSGGTTTNRTSCLAKEMTHWDSSSYSECKNNDYLYNSSLAQWTMTTDTNFHSAVFGVFINAIVGTSDTVGSYAVRPTVYLNSSVLIVSGDGSQGNPYILSA